jgi:hypothetical protein
LIQAPNQLGIERLILELKYLSIPLSSICLKHQAIQGMNFQGVLNLKTNLTTQPIGLG